MALTNFQYDQLMRVYEQRQLDNENRLRSRFEEVYTKLPALKALDDSISEKSLSQARRLLDGDDGAFTDLKKELHLLFEKKKELLSSIGYPADYLEIHYTCPDCKDTGYIGSQKCHCFKKAIIDLLYTQSNLQQVLERENFDTFCLDYYSSSHIDPVTGRSSLESMQDALKSCHEFVDTFDTEFKNLLLYGDTGVGKTFLSHCIAKSLLEQSFSVIYFTAAGLFDILAKDTFEKDREAGLVHQHIYDCDLLIIDDLGTELANSFTTSQLFTCLNERILKERSTIISTNLSLNDLNNVYSERIFSRITNTYTLLRLIGDDIRFQKRLKQHTTKNNQ